MRRRLYIIKKDSTGKTIMDMDEAIFTGNGKLYWLIYKGKIYQAKLIDAKDNFYLKTVPDKKGNYFISFMFSEE